MLFCADPTLGLNFQALAILAFLAGRPPSFAPYDPTLGRFSVCIQTFPWYNGREAGIALVIYQGATASGACRIITFGECRNTDGIFVEHWEETREPFNGPTVEERERRASTLLGCERTSFDRGQIGVVADYIYDLMASFYAENKLELVGSP